MNPTLSVEQAALLSTAQLTYPEVGQTRDQLPAGYSLLKREAVLGSGAALFERAAEALLGWELQRRAGVWVMPSAARVGDAVVANLRLGVGRAAVTAPVRVVYVVDEPRRLGFAYGTLPGHPVSGEEAFILEHRDDDTVVLQITAFSRPSSLLAKIGAPLASVLQRVVTSRYLRALEPREARARG